MSSVYNLEPPTRGKVVIHTSYGPLDIELWPKEAPKSVRNFVQLCLEGYYDGSLFHRVIKSFLVQGGDPTGSGTGGRSIYGTVFPDEFHSRLRFNHRGLLASANAGTPNSNASQFFLTLDRADWLDRKNTIFGKVLVTPSLFPFFPSLFLSTSIHNYLLPFFISFYSFIFLNFNSYPFSVYLLISI